MSNKELNKVIAEINKWDDDQVEAQLQIANLLCAIKEHELFSMGGYSSFDKMVKSELVFPVATANQYVSFYRAYTRLKYSKTQIFKLMQTFGWRKVQKAIGKSKRKLGQRAIESHLKALEAADCQFNMHIQDAEITQKVDNMLGRFGMEASVNGRRNNMTNAFIKLLEDYERLTSIVESETDNAPSKSRSKAKLKAVA